MEIKPAIYEEKWNVNEQKSFAAFDLSISTGKLSQFGIGFAVFTHTHKHAAQWNIEGGLVSYKTHEKKLHRKHMSLTNQW